MRLRHATGPAGAGQPEEIRWLGEPGAAGAARPAPSGPQRPAQRALSDPSARASAAPSRRSASLTRTASRPNARQASRGDQGPGEDHVLAAGLDAREPAALGAGERGEAGDGRVDVGEREHVALDEPPVVLGHAELVRDQRGVRAGDAHRAADRGAELRRHGVRDGGGHVAREGRDLRRLRRVVVEEALGEPHHADVEAAHERRRLAGRADGELRAAAADVDEQQRVGRRARRGAASAARQRPRPATRCRRGTPACPPPARSGCATAGRSRT